METKTDRQADKGAFHKVHHVNFGQL